MAFFNPLETEQRVLIQLVDRSDAVEATIAPIIDTLTPDVSENENYRFQGEVSRLPIEDGSQVSDHITVNPFDIELDLRFSDFVFSKFNPLASLDSSSGRGREKALKLISWFQAKRQYILTTSFASFDNVAIRQIDIPRSAADGRSVLCRVMFAEIPLVARSGLEVQGLVRSVISSVEHTAFGLIVLGDLS
jgi:hypothetical protein